MAASCGPSIPGDGLALILDAGNKDSYPLTGSNWFNLVGLNTGSLVNSPTFTSGALLTFNGSTQYVDLGQRTELQFTNTQAFTISSWVYWTSSSSQKALFSYALSGGRGYYSFVDDTGTVNTNGVFFDYYDGTAFRGVQTASNAITKNTWTNITCTSSTSNSAAGMKIYINGALSTTSNRTGTGTPSSINYSTLSAQVAARGGGSNFGGSISQVSVYNRELTAAEVFQTYNATRGRFDVVTPPSDVVTSNLIMYYDFGNPASYPGSGTSVTDLSGNGLTATLVNSPTYVSSNGGYMNFASTSYATVTNALIAPGTGDFSIDLWIQLPSASGYGHIYSIDSQATYFFKHFNGGIYDGYAQAGGGGGGTLPSGVWKHVAFSRISGTGRYYVNGVEAASRSHTFNITPTTLNIRSDGGMGEWVQAYIAVPKFYKKGLTAAEVTVNFNAHRGRFNV